MNIFKMLFSKEPAVDVKPLIQNGALLLDVRTAGEYAAGHIKGSLNIPLDYIENRLEQLGAKNGVIVVFCQSGGRSSMAKSILEKHGFNNVVNGESWKQVQKCID